MKTLALRTDTEQAFIALYQNERLVRGLKWQAGRELSATLHQKIDELLSQENATLAPIAGIAVYKGPGSFTGLRIGIASMNALAYSLDVPIVGTQGDDWLKKAQDKLTNGENHHIIQPYYGADAKTTKPRK